MVHRKSGPFVYRDDFTSPEIQIQDLDSWEYLGNPEYINRNKYEWGKVKLPPGKTWNKDAKHFRDKEYVFTKISFFDNMPDLFIKFTPSRNRNGFLQYSLKHKASVWFTFKQKALYLTIKNYSELCALQVIHDLGQGCEFEEGGFVFGRHFENGIITFWNTHNLPLGFTKQERI